MSSPTDTFSGDVYRPLLVREPSGGFILWQSRQWTIPYNPYMDAPLPCLIKQKDQLNGIECNLQLGERATRLGTWAACAPPVISPDLQGTRTVERPASCGGKTHSFQHVPNKYG
jgi:hypothetical protein